MGEVTWYKDICVLVLGRQVEVAELWYVPQLHRSFQVWMWPNVA